MTGAVDHPRASSAVASTSGLAAPGRFRVAMINHIWPHYRLPVMLALDASDRVFYTFLSGGQELEGVEHADVTRVRRFVTAPYRYIGRKLWQPRVVSLTLTKRYDCIVCLGDPNFLSSWVAAAFARWRGVPLIFWTHGWLRPEGLARRRVRHLFYKLACQLLVYAERGKELGVRTGYPAERITVVYNSLDLQRADDVISRIESGDLKPVDLSSMFAVPDLPLVICTARLTAKCRFDLLFEAAELLAKARRPVNILLIGDGPARAALQSQANLKNLNVHFYGACYDEDIVGSLIYRADLTVSPGKVGLTAIHSLMYGTPVLTHDNLDEQMPEVEAIEPGVTGLLFRQGDFRDLAKRIAQWLDPTRDRHRVRRAARDVVCTKWSPGVQAAIIENALLEAIGRGPR